MSDFAGIITAVVGGATALGGTARFIWNKLERRFENIEGQLHACQVREMETQKRGAVKLTVIELLWQEVDRLTPSTPNPTLRRVKILLDGLKLPEPSRDLEMLAREIDRKGNNDD